MHVLTDTWFLFNRHFRATLRMPAFIFMSVTQPILWLFLFGQLFGAMSGLSGFEGENYTQFLAPGLAIMTALYGAAFSGVGLLVDMEQGVLDRFLATSVSRSAIILGRMGDIALQGTVQAGILIAAAALVGAYPASFQGLLLVLLAAALFIMAFAGLSQALALVVLRQEALMGVINFLVLPLVFISSMMMDPQLMPPWIRSLSRFNPVDWAVVVARGGFEGQGLSEVGLQLGLLAGFAAVSVSLAVTSLKGYSNSR